MKGIIYILITLIVGNLASPAVPTFQDSERNDQRIVTGSVKKAVEEASKNIRDAGLDPFGYDGSIDYELPVAVIFAANAFVDSLEFTGLSNIVINRLTFSIITNRLKFNISLPRLSLRVASSGFWSVFFGDEIDGSVSGSLDIIQPRIVGDVKLYLGIISGVTVRRLSLVFSLDRIESNLNLKLFGFDLSDNVNTYLGRTLPGKITRFSREINDLVEKIAWSFIKN